jgi:cbb3-type cytochrome oxidase subunit 3
MISMRDVMIVSSWWALATTLLSLLVPYVYFRRGEKRAAKEHRLNVLYDGY